MMVQGSPAHLLPPHFAASSAETHPAPGASRAVPGALPQRDGGSSPSDTAMQPPSVLGKRKAETQDNERLSKRLSLLNLERSGNKLYVPVETPHLPALPSAAQTASQPLEHMELDDSKHKVYIYNLDDELSSESSDEEGRLVFLPDIRKHLRESRIPKQVLANRDGELAGMQLVLYKEPASLLVPEHKDGAPSAVLEAKQRIREKQKLDHNGASSATTSQVADEEAMDVD
ncbi:uncharacterized protein MAM_05354 [Metarhizium album ARSEF 1941]|uniref:Uncharacterized protein n=1 Tax=Metarhizium album (strain ARSEF 1941) TaxID=1081103 RepID=A0A0B2WS06_METAS|nr:uncharacterized protein MAM_05354 [Metarhizium album ARSEF 1941]KHN96798.1 hypothetical protein MAM_05354 [Metarhizium album ARSEF 1941]